MKTLLIKLTAFVLLPMPLLVALNWQFHTRFKSDTSDLFRRQREFLAGDTRIRFLVLGNSRARRGIDGDLLEKAVVLSTPGESFAETHGHLRYILQRTDKRIETVILPSGLATFKPMDFRRSYYWVEFVDYWDVGWRNGELGTYVVRDLEARIVPYKPLFRQRLGAWVTRLAGLETGDRDVDKQTGDFSEYDTTVKRKLVERDVEVLNQVGLLDNAAISYLSETLRLLQEHDVQAVFVKFPLTREFRVRLRELAVRQNYPQDQIDAMIQASAHCRLLDYERLFENQEHLFGDHHHLNENGRRELTLQLMRDLGVTGHP